MVIKEIIESNFPYVTVRFGNGEVVTFDVKKSLASVRNTKSVKYILDPKNFDNMKVNDHTVVWDNGVGFDPDSIYENWNKVNENKSASCYRPSILAALKSLLG